LFKTAALKYTINVIRLFLVAVLFSFTVSGCAIKADGYIANNNSDTIYGRIQLSRFDQVTGGFILNGGIDEESLHSRVYFAKTNERKFSVYYPEMLLGFGFEYKSVNYTFRRVVVPRKSIFKSEKQQYRFMRFLDNENGESRYKDAGAMKNPGMDANQDEFLRYSSHRFRVKKGNREKNDTLKNL